MGVLRVEHLTDDDLVQLIELYNDLAGGDYTRGFQEFASDLCDVLRVEVGRRVIARAMALDPVGYCWYGKLDPAPPG